jgi:hypothetical protein
MSLKDITRYQWTICPNNKGILYISERERERGRERERERERE